MKVLLVISIFIFPTILYILRSRSKELQTAFNALAIVSTIIFGMITSTTIFQIIVDNAVFMTTIHGIFLNPFFLISASYLGVYVIYRLLIITLSESRSS